MILLNTRKNMLNIDKCIGETNYRMYYLCILVIINMIKYEKYPD